ncbi:MAG: polymerase subunit sigma-24 [Candidatus Nomurabacteria bacterium]|jgi:RNA polymerase sigma-70 factor (ECF subfamily)|nr:polymerase subunit sigma-24 [Candidatus Nomurabacteria bacterium]
METTIINCSDSELVLRFQAGDDTSFDIIMKRYQKFIYEGLLKRTFDKDLSKDLRQDTFIKAFEHLKHSGKPHDPNGNLKIWLHRIAINLCMDHYRKCNRHPLVSLEELPTEEYVHLFEYQPSPEDLQIVEEEKQLVRTWVAQLCTEQKDTVMFRHYAHLPFKDIAKINGISINTAVGRHRYALNNLRKIIERNVSLPLLHAS